jgi:hypothetical protein
MDRNDVMAGAKAFGSALEGPFGRRKLQPVIAEHLDYFQKARASGALWPQIADALTRAGVRSPDGKPYRANMLRALVSRAERASNLEPAVPKAVAAPTLSPVEPSRDFAKAKLPRQRPTSAKSSSAPADASSLDTVRDRMARTSRLRGLDRKKG